MLCYMRNALLAKMHEKLHTQHKLNGSKQTYEKKNLNKYEYFEAECEPTKNKIKWRTCYVCMEQKAIQSVR